MAAQAPAPLQTVSIETTRQVRVTCLCLHAQRAARALARRFDRVLKPAGLTNGQFSLLNALNGPGPPTLRAVAQLIGADRTPLTAALKPLVRRGMAEVLVDEADSRVRRIALTDEGRARLAQALPLWIHAHAELETGLSNPGDLRVGLNALARPPADTSA
jgi:DNA-binding MarR family transcriptional regulator